MSRPRRGAAVAAAPASGSMRPMRSPIRLARAPHGAAPCLVPHSAAPRPARRSAAAVRAVVLLAALAGGALPCAAERGFLGIGISIDGEGLVINRLVKAVRVERVVQGSPAARAGITLGDEIVEVDGRTVRGSRVSELQPLLDQPAGRALRLVVRKPSGQLVELRPVLESRPPP